MNYRRRRVELFRSPDGNGRGHTVVKYTLVVLLIYLSGNIFFMGFHYAVAVGAVGAIVGLVALEGWMAGSFKLAARSVIQLCVYGIFMALTMIVNGDSKFSPYLAIFLQMLIAAVVAEIIPVNEFAVMSSQVIATLAVVSLAFFAIGMLFPDVVRLFPYTPAIASVDYYNAIVHVYEAPIGYGEFRVFSRNNGIFWEPGAYQAFLNVGLFFLLDERVVSGAVPRSRQAWQGVAIGLAVLTTFSAMGYVLLAVVLWHRRKVVARLSRHFFMVAIGLLGAVVVAVGLYVPRLNLGFLKYTADPSLVGPRFSLDKLSLLGDGFVHAIFGVSFSSAAVNVSNIWNSIISTGLVFGLVFTGFMLGNYYRGVIAMCAKPLALILILFLVFSTESLIWRPYFLCFAFAHIPARGRGNVGEAVEVALPPGWAGKVVMTERRVGVEPSLEVPAQAGGRRADGSVVRRGVDS